MKIDYCTMDDFEQITSEIAQFWGSDRTLHLHQSYLVHEFGNTAFVIHEGKQVIAYLFGFFSQTENRAYVHLIGVREGHQRKGLGKVLYDKFIGKAKERGINKIKAITTPGNSKSINFHQKIIGMKLLGKPNKDGINVIENYSGPNNDRVVFERDI
jgi:GNAT superfamily N-acetyltransferase